MRVLVLVHEDLVPPNDIEGLTDKQIAPWKTEYDVIVTLEELGHEVRPLGVGSDLAVLREAIADFKPHIVFNLLEEFCGQESYVPHVLGFLEIKHTPYTGCNPRGLMLAGDKELSKTILKHHRIAVPDFAVFLRGRTARRPKRLSFPLIVKSATAHGSIGIAQASLVTDDKQLAERAEFIYQQLSTDVIVEQYVDGRELYVGVMGNRRIQTLPVWEIHFDKLPEGAPRIVTEKIKWDLSYQAKSGVVTGPARDLPEHVMEKIVKLAKRVYRSLGQTGYARLDLRLTADEKIYVLESNPNPQLSYGEDFAESAHSVGIEYGELIQRILKFGLQHHTQTVAPNVSQDDGEASVDEA